MEIFTLLLIALTLLSPIFFWMYILQSFPSLGIWRKQFFMGIWAGALTTLPLIYSDFWIVGGLIESIFFSLSYISESILWFTIWLRLLLFFILVFILGYWFIYLKKHIIPRSYIRSCIWYSVLILGFSFTIFFVYSIFWNPIDGEMVTSWDYVFQWFALIFWYYIIISLLEEGLKYFWNSQALLGGTKNFYKLIWYACATWLGFAFFENLLYSYSYYQQIDWLEGLFQLVFFRSVFTVSLHILCAILLAAWLYIFSQSSWDKKRMCISLLWLWWWAILSHAFFDIALSYEYIGVIFLYVFTLYITVVYITNEWWAESNSY